MITIGYWGILGAGEYSKWVASHLGVAFEEKTEEREEWFATRKASLGLDLPNLPYLLDGDFKISESKAIPYYIAHKANKPEIVGGDLIGQTKVRMFIDFIDDLVNKIKGAIFAGEKEKIAERLGGIVTDAGFKTKFEYLSKSLGDKEFLTGAEVTLADFHFAWNATLLGVVLRSAGVEDIFTTHDNLKALVEKVKALPGVAARIAATAGRPALPPTFFPFELKP